MTFALLRASRHYPATVLAATTLLLVSGWLAVRFDVLDGLPLLALIAVLLLNVATVPIWWTRWMAPSAGTGHWVGRRDDASQRAGGVATWLDIGQYAGAFAVRRRAAVLRPSLATRNPVQRWRIPLQEFAVPLIRTSWFPIGNVVYSTCENVTLRFGGPRMGKTSSLGPHAVDAPGALLVTTSRTDLLVDTGPARQLRGRVEVFNPTGLGDLKSTVRWSTVAGCEEYATALRRAGDLIPEGHSAEGERWDAQARGLLAVLLHAAALEGRRLRDVLDWISPADRVAEQQIVTALAGSPNRRALEADVRSIYGTNERTLTSITTTMLPGLRWLNDATAADAGDAAPDDPDLLDLSTFVVRARDSLYLIGRDGGARTLIGALTAEVAHQVRMHAAAAPSGRLDPPMTAVLDEAPLTCGPIPLHDWTADMGGRGLTLHIAAQSPAQLRDVWGRDRAAAIMGNAASVLIFGGLKDAGDVADVSALCGSRLMALDPDDNRPLPVMTAAEVRELPVGTALVLANSLRPVIGRASRLPNARRARRLRPTAAPVTVRVRPPRLALVPLDPPDGAAPDEGRDAD